jgi:hypothetical protein
MRARIIGVLTLMLLAVTLGPPVLADQTAPLGESDRAAIRGVIENQIAAFRREDGAAAFAYAAPSIQAQFGDPAQFMEMVRRGYQPVYHPNHVTFGELSQHDNLVVQSVEVVGADGAPATALYFMEHEPDGTWRISGCVLLGAQSVGA